MDDFIMPWGKYQNKTMEEIPSGYLKWLMDKCDDDEIRIEAEEEYDFRTLWKSHWD